MNAGGVDKACKSKGASLSLRAPKCKMQNAKIKMKNQNSKRILFAFYIFILHFDF